MKHVVSFILCIAVTASLVAQGDESKEYAKMKVELSEKIFGSTDSYFKTTEIPEKYKNESIVVLAQETFAGVGFKVQDENRPFLQEWC
ncbi:MAG: hypothetical protein WDN26_14645 [Chitinophagaceae bacterium]